MSIRLPEGVPCRTLFQCGPSGEDPLADSLEMDFRAILVEDSAKSCLLVKGCVDPGALEARIQTWISALKQAEFTISETSNPVVMAAISEEVTHFIRNSPWICSAQASGHSVQIVGCETAVNICSERLRVSLRHLNVDFQEFLAPFVSKEASNFRQNPYYRFLGPVMPLVPPYLSADSHIPAPRLVPVSIFDSLDAVAPPIVATVMTYRRKVCKLDKIHTVPELVLRRLESAVGIGCKLVVVENFSVEIYVSNSEAELDAAESMLKACVNRRHCGGDSCTELFFAKKIPKETLQRLESEFNVLIVAKESGVLILASSEVSRKRCQIFLLNKADPTGRIPDAHVHADLGNILSRRGKAGHGICQRAARASGAAVGLLSGVLIIAGNENSKKFAKMCVEMLLQGESTLPVIKVPVGPVFCSSNRLEALESKWSCIIVSTPDAVTVDVVASSEANAIFAAVDIIYLCEKLSGNCFNFSALSGISDKIVTIPEVSISSNQLEAVGEALQVYAKKVGRVVLVAAHSSAQVQAAVEVINRIAGKPFNASQYEAFRRKLDFGQPGKMPLCSESIGISIGCICFFNDTSVDIVSASSLRREVCAQIMSAPNPEDELDIVTAPWR